MKLFSDFPKISRDQWVDKINQDLSRKEQVFEDLISDYEGTKISPVYTQEDTSSWQIPNLKKSSGVSIVEKIFIGDDLEGVRFLINEAIHFGATDIYLIVDGVSPKMLTEIFKDIDTQSIGVLFEVKSYKTSLPVIRSFFQDIPCKELSVLRDGVGEIITGKLSSEDISDFFDELVDGVNDSQVARSILINGVKYIDSGASIKQEIAYCISQGVSYIEALLKRGCSIDTIAKNIQFNIGTSANYFFEIAKVASLRYLWNKVLRSYNANYVYTHIHSVSSKWNKTLFDRYNNILRSTTESMAAILGGVDSLFVEDYEAHFVMENPSDHARSTARNIPLLLKEEAFLDKIGNPTEGAYYISSLQKSLISESWAIFLTIEEKKGFISAAKEGFIQELISQSRENKLQDFQENKDVIIGVNHYLNNAEKIDHSYFRSVCVESNSDQGIITPTRVANNIEKQIIKKSLCIVD